jgi:exportin-1
MEAAQQILNFDVPLDTKLFDQVVNAFFQGNMAVQPLLVQFQENPKAWTRVDAIMESCEHPNSKILALGILENSVKYRWKVLPADQREGIKEYIVNLIIKLSQDKQTLQASKVLLSKLNLVLVEIVKQEWPHNWPKFIPDLVNSSKTSESLCANNMNVLLLLSEEIFDYSAEQMTSTKVQEMKKNLHSEFTLIFRLCDYVLQKSEDPALLTITIKTLLRFLMWIPVGYIFETSLIETLAVRFFPVSIFQNDTLKCLSEIGSIKISDQPPAYSQIVVRLFHSVIDHVSKLITADMNVANIYHTGNQSTQTFLRHLTIFITGCLGEHLNLFENGDDATQQALYKSLVILLKISDVEDRVIFKICLEYWSSLVTDLFSSNTRSRPTGLMLGQLASQQQNPRLQKYREILHRLRYVMIEHMPKPEEVLIVEDENGQIVRETLKDSDSITLYKNMRECLIILTHLDPTKNHAS